jgi:hypothetical protein
MAGCKGGVATNPAMRGCFAVRSDSCHADETVRRPESRNREGVRPLEVSCRGYLERPQRGTVSATRQMDVFQQPATQFNA